jgi:hypothetical protein
MSSVIPITAYELLQNEQRVSVFYTFVSLVGLAGSLLIPLLIGWIGRRWVYTLGAASLIAGAAGLATFTVEGQVAAMLGRALGSASLSICLSLYVMDNIGKEHLVRTESLRMASSTPAWSAGPFLGVWLYQTYGLWVASAAASGFAVLLMAAFWWFRLTDGSPIRPAKRKPPNPLANLYRFAVQPRLRLVWFIAFARSAYWSTFFVYGPILMVSTGQGKLAGGLFSSLGNVMLITAMFWARAAYRFSLRRAIAACFAVSGVLLLVAGYTGAEMPFVTAAMLLAGTLCASGLDAMGSTPFLRAVKARERAEMTAVYRTYLDFSDLAPSFIYAILLTWFGLGSVFASLSLLMFLGAILAWRFLPRRM